MASVTRALGSEPRRIVSLVPSDSYTLARLGAGERLVGRTEYCVAPPEILAAPAVGGTKNADVDAIVALCPDLVIANREENREADIHRLEKAGVEVLLSFPCTVADGLLHAEAIAALFPSIDNTARLAELRERWQRHAAAASGAGRAVERAPIRVFVPIWMDPLMTANGATFLSDVIELCGGRNVFSDRPRRYPLKADLGLREPVDPGPRDTRYPRVTLAEVALRRPELVLLPDEPHAFSEADAEVIARAFDGAGAPRPAIRFVAGKSLMWYGVRALEDLDEVASWLARAAASR